MSLTKGVIDSDQAAYLKENSSAISGIRYISETSDLSGFKFQTLKEGEVESLATETLVGLTLLVPARKGFSPIKVEIETIVCSDFFDVLATVEPVGLNSRCDVGLNHVKASVDRVIAPMIIRHLVRLQRELKAADMSDFVWAHTQLATRLVFNQPACNWGPMRDSQNWGDNLPAPILRFIAGSKSLEEDVKRMSIVAGMFSMIIQ